MLRGGRDAQAQAPGETERGKEAHEAGRSCGDPTGGLHGHPQGRLRGAGEADGAGSAGFGLYVHVPYCRARCFYCDFVLYPWRGDGRAFREAAVAEMALYAERPEWAGRPLRTIFFGGGTPTVLPAQDLAVLAAAVRRRFAVTPDAEWSIEANPEGLDGDLLAALAAAGWNRLSLGLQDWDDDRLRALGRRHTVADFLAAFRAARRAGFANINVDLVYGLPGQTPAAWRATLIRVVELGPEHISAYALQVEEGTAFARWAREGRLDRPDEDTCAEMYAIACEELARHGYRRYEVSNFARPGHRCRHNLTYWRNGDYLGIGPGAHSHLALPAPGGPSGLRWANLRTVGAYRQAVTAGSLPRAEEETCPPEREMSDTVILGLRLDEGVDLDAFQARFGRPVEAVFQPAVDRLEHMGLLRREPGRLRLTDRAWPVANRVFAAFLDVAPTAAAF